MASLRRLLASASEIRWFHLLRDVEIVATLRRDYE